MPFQANNLLPTYIITPHLTAPTPDCPHALPLHLTDLPHCCPHTPPRLTSYRPVAPYLPDCPHSSPSASLTARFPPPPPALPLSAESSVGIREGGTTGITALVCAFGFGISMFLSPIFASIPPYATGPAVIFVGALMFEHARLIEWRNVRQAVPAFLTIIMMPLTYSIAYGVIIGIFAAIMIWFADVVCDTFMSLAFKSRPMRQVSGWSTRVTLERRTTWSPDEKEKIRLSERKEEIRLSDRKARYAWRHSRRRLAGPSRAFWS